MNKNVTSSAVVKSVATTIIEEFFVELAKEEGFEELADRLRKVVLEERLLTEATVRTALFEEAP